MPTGAAAFVLRLDQSLHARIAAIPASDMAQSEPSTIGPNCEVTVNGGTSRPYPATVWAATQIVDSAGASQLALTGVGLDQVQSVVAQSGVTSPARATPANPARLTTTASSGAVNCCGDESIAPPTKQLPGLTADFLARGHSSGAASGLDFAPSSQTG